jgi:hypothetical protein
MPVFARRLTFLCLCLVVGCSRGEPAADPAQSDRMLNVLTTALDAWKAGAAANLASYDPPIRFADDDLIAGRRLTDYHLEDPDSLVLPFESVFVNLSLQTADGKTFERRVGYQISLTPKQSVLRSEP